MNLIESAKINSLDALKSLVSNLKEQDRSSLPDQELIKILKDTLQRNLKL
jgi:hypothetical protein